MPLVLIVNMYTYSLSCCSLQYFLIAPIVLDVTAATAAAILVYYLLSLSFFLFSVLLQRVYKWCTNDLSLMKGNGSTNNGTSFIKEGNRSIKNDKILTWQRTVLMSMSSIKPSSRNNCDPLSISHLTTSSNSNQSASSNQFGRCRATRKRGKYRLCLIFKYPSVHRRNGTATSRQPKNDHL